MHLEYPQHIHSISIVFQGSAWALGPVQSLALNGLTLHKEDVNMFQTNVEQPRIAQRATDGGSIPPQESCWKKDQTQAETERIELQIREIRDASPRIWQVFEQERRWSHVLHAARCLVPGAVWHRDEQRLAEP